VAESVAGVELLVEVARVLERVDGTQSEEESDVAGVAPGSVGSDGTYSHGIRSVFGRLFSA
jgi:hypothetical protein